MNYPERTRFFAPADDTPANDLNCAIDAAPATSIAQLRTPGGGAT
jgi:hypothetical protein